MSNSNLKAADDARRLLRGFAGIAEVADAFERVGSLQQAESECTASLAKLRDELTATHNAIEAAELEALRVRAEAEREAEQAAAAASAKAMALVADAQTQAVNIELAAEGIKAQAQALLAAAQAETQQATAKRDALEAECAELDKRAAKARAYLAKLVD